MRNLKGKAEVSDIEVRLLSYCICFFRNGLDGQRVDQYLLYKYILSYV